MEIIKSIYIYIYIYIEDYTKIEDNDWVLMNLSVGLIMQHKFHKYQIV